MDLRRSESVPTPPKRHDKPEVLLGKYQLGRLLGRGTFAKVYYARSIADGSGVFVKVLDKPQVLGTGMTPQVLCEVSAMHRLSHPNIVKQIQSVPLVIGQFMEMVDQNNGIVGSDTGSDYYDRILSTVNWELLKPSASVALCPISPSPPQAAPILSQEPSDRSSPAPPQDVEDEQAPPHGLPRAPTSSSSSSWPPGALRRGDQALLLLSSLKQPAAAFGIADLVYLQVLGACRADERPRLGCGT